MAKEVHETDGPRLRADVEKLNHEAFKMCQKSDLEKLGLELARVKNMVMDLKDDASAMKAQVTKV